MGLESYNHKVSILDEGGYGMSLQAFLDVYRILALRIQIAQSRNSYRTSTCLLREKRAVNSSL